MEAFAPDLRADQRLTVVGGLPAPIGGITTFLRRMLYWHNEKIDTFVDIYPANKEKFPFSNRAQLILVNGRMGLLLWMLRNFVAQKNRVIFFNFSQPRALLLLCLLPRLAQTDWHLMLHHGNLKAGGKLSGIAQRLALKRFSRIYSLSQGQRAFYEAQGVDADRLAAKTSYCPPIPAANDVEGAAAVAALRKNCSRIVVMSGFPQHGYGFEHGIRIFQQTEPTSSRLVIFIYGPGDQRTKLQKLPTDGRIVLFEDKGENFFNSFLAASDELWRLNDVDSFGIAVADAVSLGLTVMATDVCARWPGTKLVSVDDLHEPSNQSWKQKISTARRKDMGASQW